MDARRLPARHGVLWLLAGFALFRRHPPLATAITFGYLLTVIVVNLIPKIGPFLLPLLLPTLTVILANGCRAIDRRQPFGSETLMRGINEHRAGLARLGGLHLVGSSLLVLGGFALGDPVTISDGLDPEEAMALVSDMAVILLLASPMLMAFWFAPLLTAWDGVGAVKSLFFSFVASLRNWRAFMMYGLALVLVGAIVPGMILIIAGLISPVLLNIFSVALRMLLIFVLAPTMVASVYLSYRDVFRGPAEPDE
ncbi:MAG: putative transmembrane protein [Rhodocyclaceae bacterium]|nr:MAG: putative transmembrane protein [Rhodocyclaceae bacterium]TND04629.1 MAG: putative transmembrane protein [Rhodocyclaceae bacterium]